jgi:galactose mutarotase-like enzyme
MNDVIILKKGSWEAGVCARFGGNMIYLTYNGKHILRPLVDESQVIDTPYLQGSPILLPANRTYLGKFTFEGI